MKINSIQLNNKSKKYISFQENSVNNLTPGIAILSLQNPNARVKFEKDLRISRGADAVQSNPFKAFGYKLYKTFKLFVGPKADSSKKYSVTI